MPPARFVSSHNDTDNFSQHASVNPQVDKLFDGTPNCSAGFDGIHAAEHDRADLHSRPEAIFNFYHFYCWIQRSNCAFGGLNLESSYVGTRIALGRDIRGVYSVEVHQLQSSGTHSCQLQTNLPTNGPHSD